MKNLVRAFVIALTLTGAVASAHTPKANTTTEIASVKANALPIPMCPPDDPNTCGLGK